ncbi:1-acyl-sn-glycerol-3-phosphate acyltransferase [Sporanaerobium hydrogeniformans]|uniref:1-acyl-sn-glycerol-3-phosphate acyltransferase n=1 Tax=Sporanaerobium hydrogeniformans TaxID=3072179 RepID=A0AC61D9E1_9FIRM|nr:lysophospholipid acyltransferase family protein [Sporanaerobium hydrogeniformans]PHV69874.1 1-acyl-sn-glycerol-3-phosphate acyltransferase [Sporanaerobium hydrogeniformans]
MLRSVGVVSTMVWHQFRTVLKRKEYTYGNAKHEAYGSRQEIFKMAKAMSKDMLKAAGTRLEVKGEENLPESGPVLYVANHKSVFDIVILMSILKEPGIFIGKKEVSKMPLVGKWFEDMGSIYIDREDPRQSLKAILKGIEELKKGQSVIIFPEGTRTYAPEMKDFKEGSFKLATKTNVPIIPIALQDTYKILEASKSIKQTTAYMNIGKPIYIDQLKEEERRNLPHYVHAIVVELLNEITVL